MLLTGLSTEARAQMSVAAGRDTLRGLPGIEVIVDTLEPTLEQAGLTSARLRDNIVHRLRDQDIQVFTSQVSNPSDAKPYLYVDLTTLEIPGQDLVVVAIQVKVRQTVRAAATLSNIVDATTWDSHTIVGLPSKQLPRLPELVGEHVERFIRDWKAVH